MEYQSISSCLLPQFSDLKQCICSSDNFIGSYCYETTKIKKVWEIPKANVFKQIIVHNPLTRFIRQKIGIQNVVMLTEGRFLVFYDKIYFVDPNSKKDQIVLDFQKENILPPLKNGIAYNPNTNSLYFGEYQNNRPFPVRIIELCNNFSEWRVVYRFPCGKIKHVHSIQYDKYRDRLWICTGDNNEECAILFTDNNFSSVEVFGQGNQTWRAVSLIINEHCLIWGTDAGKDVMPYPGNFIYKYNFNLCRRSTVALIDKPAYYSIKTESGMMFIGTTYEPGLPESINRTSDVWFSIDGDTWECIFSFKYKNRNYREWSKYGTIYFPSGTVPDSNVMFSPVNVKKLNFNLLKTDISNK